MKKIAIVTRKMVAGGIERTLISMLENIPKDEYDITLFVMAKGGEFEKDIPTNVKVKCLYGDEKNTSEKIIKNIKRLRIKKASKIIYYTILSKGYKYVFDKELCHSKMIGIVNEEFDLAIADHVPASFPVVYVVNNIKAKKRAAWIHADVSLYKMELERYKKYYYKYDKIFSVSREAKDKFESMYPELKNKLDIFYNIVSKKKLQLLSDEGDGFRDNFNGIRILTIGRLCHQKGQDLIPSVVKRLIKKGHDFKWYCIGDGDYRDILTSKIHEYKIEDKLILLGSKQNPYRYLKECDIYVQPSRHEGYCTTVTEAKCFNKPMVITEVNGSNEQIINMENGMIVDIDNNKIFEAIDELLNNNKLKNKFIQKLKLEDVDTIDQLDKLYNLINE